MVGPEVLAFCSTNSTLLGTRLNVPSALLRPSGDVMVSRVAVENYTAYADAALAADIVRW